jgi:transposase-like protein
VKEKQKYRKYSVEFKVEAVQRMLAGENIKGLSRVLDVPRSQLYAWLDRYRAQGAERLRGPGRPSFEEAVQILATPAEVAAKRIVELERKVGQQTLEVDFLKKACERVKESRQRSNAAGGTASTERSAP